MDGIGKGIQGLVYTLAVFAVFGLCGIGFGIYKLITWLL